MVSMQDFYTWVFKALCTCLIHTFALELLTTVLSLFDIDPETSQTCCMCLCVIYIYILAWIHL